MEQMGVYKLYSLGRMSEKVFSKDIKVLNRDLHVVTNEWAEHVNRYSEINGLFYEKDEKATKLYYEGQHFKAVKEYTDFEEIKEEKQITDIDVNGEIVVTANQPTDLGSDLEKLKKMYRQQTGKSAKPLWGVKKLTEELHALNTK